MEYDKKSNLQVIKNRNKNMILKIIHDNYHISRAEIKRITGLSPTTVSNLVDELIEDGLVKESGVLDTGGVGRKAISVEINPSGMYFAGIEIDSEKIVVGIYDLRFNEAFCKETKIGNYSEILNFITETLRLAEKELSTSIKAIAIGVSGIIDTKNNRVLLSTVMDIAGENLAGDVEAQFSGVNVTLLNVSGLIAYAEAKKRGVKDLVSVDIGRGVGSGIIIDGRIYTGAEGTAGEFGHISIDMNGERCKCGNRGCTELYTNTDVIRKRAADILGENKVSLGRVRQEAENGNQKIIDMLNEITEILSYALVGLVNMMAPQSVVISGKITELGNTFLLPLKKAVADKCSIRQTEIEYSSVCGNAVTIGGAQEAFEKYINNI